jgi:hypothetical protein
VTCPMCSQEHGPNERTSTCCDVLALWREVYRLKAENDELRAAHVGVCDFAAVRAEALEEAAGLVDAQFRGAPAPLDALARNVAAAIRALARSTPGR